MEFVAGPAQSTLYAWIYDHKTLGKDKLLGSGQVDVGFTLYLYALSCLVAHHTSSDLASLEARCQLQRRSSVGAARGARSPAPATRFRC